MQNLHEKLTWSTCYEFVDAADRDDGDGEQLGKRRHVLEPRGPLDARHVDQPDQHWNKICVAMVKGDDLHF